MISTIVFTLIATTPVMSWGSDAHEVVGLVAQQLLDSNTATFVSNVLSGASLGSVATWADQIKRNRGYTWSGRLHYIDIDTKVPSSCGYNDNRDCADGNCIVGAIGNYTHRASCKAQLDSKQQEEAVKFLAHFAGDVTQPLHACARDKGGNDDKIHFGGQSVNFHASWDTNIPEKRISDDFNGDKAAYASHLVQTIKSDSFPSSKSTWLSGHDVFETKSNGNSLAAIDWATDSNWYDCNYVWGPFDQDPSQDFSQEYYRNVVPVVDIQIAKGGYRLANLLSQIAGTCANGSDKPKPHPKKGSRRGGRNNADTQ